MQLTPFMTLEAVETLLRTLKTKRNYERLMAIRLLLKGLDPSVVAEELHRSRATIYNWAALWNKRGWETLRYQPSPGRPAKVTPGQVEELAEILSTQTPIDFLWLHQEQAYWDLETTTDFVNGYFETNYTYFGVWRLVRERLGFQYTKPYPTNYQRPLEAERHLKKIWRPRGRK